jgi:hypothetical protein
VNLLSQKCFFKRSASCLFATHFTFPRFDQTNFCGIKTLLAVSLWPQGILSAHVIVRQELIARLSSAILFTAHLPKHICFEKFQYSAQSIYIPAAATPFRILHFGTNIHRGVHFLVNGVSSPTAMSPAARSLSRAQTQISISRRLL